MSESQFRKSVKNLTLLLNTLLASDAYKECESQFEESESGIPVPKSVPLSTLWEGSNPAPQVAVALGILATRVVATGFQEEQNDRYPGYSDFVSLVTTGVYGKKVSEKTKRATIKKALGNDNVLTHSCCIEDLHQATLTMLTSLVMDEAF